MNFGMGELIVLLVVVLGVMVFARGLLRGLRPDGVRLARCPLCRTPIASDALVCPNCKRDLPNNWAPGSK